MLSCKNIFFAVILLSNLLSANPQGPIKEWLLRIGLPINTPLAAATAWSKVLSKLLNRASTDPKSSPQIQKRLLDNAFRLTGLPDIPDQTITATDEKLLCISFPQVRKLKKPIIEEHSILLKKLDAIRSADTVTPDEINNLKKRIEIFVAALPITIESCKKAKHDIATLQKATVDSLHRIVSPLEQDMLPVSYLFDLCKALPILQDTLFFLWVPKPLTQPGEWEVLFNIPDKYTNMFGSFFEKLGAYFSAHDNVYQARFPSTDEAKIKQNFVTEHVCTNESNVVATGFLGIDALYAMIYWDYPTTLRERLGLPKDAHLDATLDWLRILNYIRKAYIDYVKDDMTTIDVSSHSRVLDWLLEKEIIHYGNQQQFQNAETSSREKSSQAQHKTNYMIKLKNFHPSQKELKSLLKSVLGSFGLIDMEIILLFNLDDFLKDLGYTAFTEPEKDIIAKNHWAAIGKRIIPKDKKEPEEFYCWFFTKNNMIDRINGTEKLWNSALQNCKPLQK